MGLTKLATNGQKDQLTTDKNISTVYRQPTKPKILTDNRQIAEILTDERRTNGKL